MSWIKFRFVGFGYVVPIVASVITTGGFTLLVHQNARLKDDLTYARYERDLVAQLYVSDKLAQGEDGGIRENVHDPNLPMIVFNPKPVTKEDKELRLNEKQWFVPTSNLVGNKHSWPTCSTLPSSYSAVDKNKQIEKQVVDNLKKVNLRQNPTCCSTANTC